MHTARDDRTARRRILWTNTVTVASLLIAFAAAGFTWLQWRETHNNLLLTLKPHVDFDIWALC